MRIEEYDLEALVEPLLDWFSGHARILPWREDATPYRVWVSEIMLQQTRVEAVKPYFERFVETLPDIQALAGCGEEQLLKLWEGLGYYNRVRNMQVAARQVMEEYGGTMPSSYDALLKLKGIGHYTAGAVASIAYGKAVPAVDGNVLRVISRAAADERDIMKQSVRTNMEEQLQKIIPDGRAGAFNQALMELGATVCVPNGEAKCSECPWEQLCLAKREGKITELPKKSKAAKRRIEERTVFLIRDGEKVLLRKRGSKGLLAGMYEFPNVEGTLSEEEALKWIKQKNLQPLRIEKAGEAKHIFSHIEWHMTGYVIWIDELEKDVSGMLYLDLQEVNEKYPIPAAFAAYIKYITENDVR